jgi:hypothetical protein
MAVLVEAKFGQQALLECLIDPRKLLVRYNRIALDTLESGVMLGTWSPAFLRLLSP